ncbi:MAG: hypothetical protein ACK504_12240 [Bacteroidota bacterium]|jgi:hypothetical protein
MVLDFHTGLLYKEGINYSKNYKDVLANDVGLKTKYPNTSALNKHYNIAFNFGIAIGYKL